MRHRRVVVAAGALACAAIGVIAVGGVAAVPTPAAAATPGCSVAYQNIIVWTAPPAGFQATLAITNLGDPINHWTLTFTMPSGQTVTTGWNATFTIGSTVTATDAGWNGSIATGATDASVGMQGTWNPAAAGSASSSPFPLPTDFTLNGVRCTTIVRDQPPSISLSTPSDGQAFITPARVNLTASASDVDGSVMFVQFLNGTTVIGADNTPPYTFAWTNVAPGTYTVSARAMDTAGGTTTTSPITISVANGPALALHVSGKNVVTAAGTPYRLLGVNRSGGEFACTQGDSTDGMWDGPVDQASIDAMKAWNVHMVRLPLNEQCWLGLPGLLHPGFIGPAYRQAVNDYVDLLVANGINVVLDLHWTVGQYIGAGAECSDPNATCQKPMPQAATAPMFWSQVATMFKGNDAVIFDLFSEPFPSGTSPWACLRSGVCSGSGIGYSVAGMQSLVNAVRATGATNIIMVAGLHWANDLTQWLAFKPTDPTGNLIASWHSYNFRPCSTVGCWLATVGSVARIVPVVAAEIGQNSCAHNYIDQMSGWADVTGVGYAGWTWHPSGTCNTDGNVLILDWAGTPTSTFGQGYRGHLLTQWP